MRRMTDAAPLPHRFVLINERAALLRVTLEAGFVSAEEGKPTSFERLLNICGRAFDGDPFVRLMAIAAAHLAFWHRMVVRQRKRCANVQVTLETSVRRLSRIDDRPSAAAGLNVQTPRSVARLATHVLCVVPLRLQSRVSRCSEVAHDLFVAGRAFL